MTNQTKVDVHWAGVYYTCYMLAKFGFNEIAVKKDSPHVTAKKDRKGYAFHVNANSENMSWGGYENTNFKFDYLVVLTHIHDEPNVFILKIKDVQDLMVLEKDRYWLNKDLYSGKGKYWDEI